MLIILTALTFLTHALPLSDSPLPFNNDGILETRIANDILDSEHLSYPDGSSYSDTYSVMTPLYNLLLAFSASCLSVDASLVTQAVVAMLSVTTVIGVYVLALRICGSYTGALGAALVLSLLGTFLFLTGSTWKGALGVAMLVLLTLAYTLRADRRFLVLEILVLLSLPFIYHLATVLAYLTLAYLTSWSVAFALLKRRFRTSHIIDVSIVGVTALAAYVYYLSTSFQRLSDYGTFENVIVLLAVFGAFACGGAIVMLRENSLRFTFAPIAGAFVILVVFIDYSDPLFPYDQGYASNVLLLGFLFGIIVALGWFGIEFLIRSNTRYRMIPLGLFLPVLTLFALALSSGFGLDSHRIFYRTFDYADIALALGVAAAVTRIRRSRVRPAFVAVLVISLVISFPFGYATGDLLGDRHDTQEYEVDAISWIDSSIGAAKPLRSDERLSYVARVLYDYGKDPYLPSRLASGNVSPSNVINILLEEWAVVGVNDYPRGHPVLDEEFLTVVLSHSNILYMGGPETNNIVVFQTVISLDSQI